MDRSSADIGLTIGCNQPMDGRAWVSVGCKQPLDGRAWVATGCKQPMDGMGDRLALAASVSPLYQLVLLVCCSGSYAVNAGGFRCALPVSFGAHFQAQGAEKKVPSCT